MRRMICALAVGLVAAAAAAGHRTVRRPDGGDPGKVIVVFGHGVTPDKNVKAETWKKLEGLKLSARGADGKATDVKWEKAEHCFKAAAPAGSRVVFGQADAGVTTRAGGKPTLVRYYPKAVMAASPRTAGRRTRRSSSCRWRRPGRCGSGCWPTASRRPGWRWR